MNTNRISECRQSFFYKNLKVSWLTLLWIALECVYFCTMLWEPVMRRSTLKHSINLTRGFLPAEDPLIALLDTSNFNIALNEIVQNFSILLREKKLGNAVDDLDLRFKGQIITIEERHIGQMQAAILFLAAITQGYIFEDQDCKRNQIPSVIATNLYHLCYLEQRRPILTYNEYALHNWQRLDVTKPIGLDNLKPILTFTGTPDEAWFINIHLAIEAECAAALNAAQDIAALFEPYAAGEQDELLFAIHNKLSIVAASLHASTHLLSRMHEGCDPAVYWESIRPYLVSWNTVDSVIAGKKGVSFVGVHEDHTRDLYAYYGPSGAQSSIIPAIDALLNIKHQLNGMFEFLTIFRSYMPALHNYFIQDVGRCKLRCLVQESDNENLREAYDEAVSALLQFRAAHIGLMHAYVHQPAANHGLGKQIMYGTGGSDADSFLSKRFKSTGEHRLKKYLASAV